MRTWEVVGKYPILDDEGVVSHTEIAVASTSSGYATFSERIIGDHSNKSEKELIALALDALFKSEFSDRAMSESVQKIAELEAVVKTAKKFMQEAEMRFADMQKAHTELTERMETAEEERNERFKVVEEKFAILNGSVMEMLVEFYASREGDGEEDERSSEEGVIGNVDGSDSSTTQENTETE